MESKGSWCLAVALAGCLLAPAAARAGESPEGAFARLVRGGTERFRAGEHAAAAELFEKALAIREEAGLWYNLGAARFLAGDAEGAEPALRKAVALSEGRHADARRLLGRLLYSRGDWAGCADQLSAALTPGGDPGSWRVLSSAFEQMDDPANALRALERAALAAPRDAALRDSLGRALFRAGRLESAVLEFRAALRIAPGNPASYRDLGYALAALGRDGEALDAFETAVRVGGTDRALHRAMGDLYAGRDMFREAAAAYAASPPESAEDRYRVAVLHLRARDPVRALVALNATVAAFPDHLPSLLALGGLQLEREELDEARRAFEKALGAAPKDPRPAAGLGDVAYRRGEFAAAVEHYEKALARSPGWATVWKALGHAEYARQRWAAAFRAYGRALEFDPADSEAASWREAAASLLRRTR